MPSLGTGGAERAVVTLSNYLSNEYDIIIVTLNNIPTNYVLKNNINVYNVEVRKFKSTNFLKALINNLQILIRINRITKKLDPNIIIGFTTTSNVFAIITALIGKRKSIICERANPRVYIPNMFWKLLRNLFYRKTNLLIVQSEFSLNYFASIVDKSKIYILLNPIDVRLYNKINLNSIKENIILTVGRLDANKNQEMLIRAFAELKINDWQLFILGDGFLKDYLIKLTKELKVEDQVKFFGNRPDVWKYYNKCKIFVFTSRSEGFPNVLLEAVIFGIPSISTNCESGPSNLIENNFNGFLIDVNNQEQLVEKLKHLILNNTEYNIMLENSIFCSKQYDPKAIVYQWKSIIDSVL